MISCIYVVIPITTHKKTIQSNILKTFVNKTKWKYKYVQVIYGNLRKQKNEKQEIKTNIKRQSETVILF